MLPSCKATPLTSCCAQGLADGGRLVACECDERPLGLARKAFEDAGVADKARPESTLMHMTANATRGACLMAEVLACLQIMLCICKGTAALQHLLREPLQEPIDFAFVGKPEHFSDSPELAARESVQ